MESKYSVIWLQFIFLISGISQTVLVNLVSYHGGASPATLLPVFSSYLAMAAVFFLPSTKSNSDHRSLEDSHIRCPSPKHLRRLSPHKFVPISLSTIMSPREFKILFLAMFDIMCCIVSFISLVQAGSAIFQLVYSSIIIITATFRHFIIPNKKLSVQQWIACVIVTGGLFLSGFGQNGSKHSESSSNLTNVSMAFGQLLWPLITTILYSIEYVMIEKLLQGKDAPSDNELCYKMGFYGLIVSCSYILIKVIPNWDSLFIHNITIHHGSGLLVLISYLWIFISNFAHNWSYFQLLKNSGAVSTGINQALRAVGVFVISGICFCDLQESQCFNSFKFLSLIIVMVGVLRYAFITAMYQHNKQGDLYMISVDQHKYTA